MLLQLLTVISLSSFALSLAYVLRVAVRNYIIHKHFSKKSPNLPVLPNPNLFSGHANEVVLSGRNWQLLDRLHKKLGKTFGLYYANQPMVSTIDLDLIKTYIIDEPDSHVNRFEPNIPLKELDIDSILFSKDNQWRRIRRSVAPAFS